MNLYLLENHSTSIRFRRGSTSTIGVANFFLRDNEMSPTGKGKLRDGRFPWLVYQSPESLQVFGFKLYVSFNITKSSEKEGIVIPATLVTEVGGDIDEIFKYVFSTSVSHPGLSLKLNGSLRPYFESTTYIQHEMTAVHGRNGGFKFLASCKINKSAANGVYDKKLSIELVKRYNDASTSSAQLHSLQELNESILKSKGNIRFRLVAENGVAMTCHRNFLEAHCPSFEIARLVWVDAALQLFLHSTKMQVMTSSRKKKAVRKGDEMESSELCDQLLRTDPKSAKMLMKALSGP
ncbi:hypothetical protein Ocin01_18461 [Orchesella cincta]|uniref:Uncharacterized protein n=1 Tax=Orchesella cincta TaxID=48709 RepID=A0A1D2M5F8_ORCCI|nr:hypothetical protein Ocin01_18461 [Orchesella cincta]